MTGLPRESALDSTLAVLREGYRFVPARCERHGSDAFRARLMGRPAVFMRGADAALAFYSQGRFTRRGALPVTALKLLQDRGSVATLDDEAHRHRKAMFLSLTGVEAVARLRGIAEAEWERAIPRWEAGGGRVVLHDAANGLLCRIACAWAGVPLAEDEVAARARELAAMIDGAGAIGPRNWRALALRSRSEGWARRLVAAVRAGRLEAPPGSALDVIARHREAGGAALSDTVAAVELINVLRPTVAVANFVVFAAHALHTRPDLAEDLRADDAALLPFAQEVRRYYPFFPAVAGRAREAFAWNGHRFGKGDWAILDLYGTNHHPALWEAPEEFLPERFAGYEPTPYELIPQGGGFRRTGHRCPGEDATLALTEIAACMLARAMDYAVPEQDLSIDLSRIPALPASRFAIEGVRARWKSPPRGRGMQTANGW